jgi:ribonuclease T1
MLTRVLRRAAGAGLAAALLACGPTSDAGRSAAPAATTTVSVSQLPVEAQQTLQLIHRGGPFPFRKDGAVFANREQLLPQRQRGYYTEYTVPTPDAGDRGPRRIVAGRGRDGDPATSGEYYYTEDHYNTFRRIRE